MRHRGKAHFKTVKNDLGQNRLEACYDNYLAMLKRAGKILDYRFEPFTLRLTYKTITNYKPDFLVINLDEYMEIHETKGYMEEDAWIKLKLAADLYPWFTFYLVRAASKKHGQVANWDIKEVG